MKSLRHILKRLRFITTWLLAEHKTLNTFILFVRLNYKVGPKISNFKGVDLKTQSVERATSTSFLRGPKMHTPVLKHRTGKCNLRLLGYQIHLILYGNVHNYCTLTSH